MPIYWTNEHHLCECGNAVMSEEDERCPDCAYEYRVNHDYYEALFSGHKSSQHDAEGLRVRAPTWRGGEE